MSSWDSWGFDEESWDSEYDSTWEDNEECMLPKQSKPKKKNCQYSRGSRAAQDLQRYRHGYPEPMLNLQFYRNEIPFKPYGVHIDTFHQDWKCDYYTLETNHNFIQWLFPLREPGMNRCAIPLTEKEIEEMKKDVGVMKRLLESYELMLGFYGIKLVDSKTGEVARADNCEDRFSNLNNHTHNNLRITRILKCLGEFGYEDHQAKLVRFFLEETLRYGNLQKVKKSALGYFMFTVKNKSVRRELVLFAWEHYEPKEKFIWGPLETLRKLRPTASSSVENPEDKSEDMEVEQENKSSKKNGTSKDDSKFQNKAREYRQESKDDRKSHWLIRLLYILNVLNPVTNIIFLILAFYCFLTGRGPISSNPANVKKRKRQKKNKIKSENLALEHGSVGKESKSQESREDSKNRGSQVKLGLEEEEGGPPMNEFASKEDKENGEQPINSVAVEDKDTKGPSTECELGNSMGKEGAKSTPQDGKENRDSHRNSWTRDKENKKQSVHSGAADNKGNTLSSTCDLKDVKEKRDSRRGSGSEENQESEVQSMHSGAADNKGNTLSSTCNLEDNKRYRDSQKGSGSAEYQENEVHSGAADNQGNALPSTCASEDVKENRVLEKGSGSEKYQGNEVQSVHSGAADNKVNTLPSTCESEDVNENSDAQKCSGSEEYQENEVHSGAADTKGNALTSTSESEDVKENRDSQKCSGSEEYQENEVHSGAADNEGNALPSTCASEDVKENRVLQKGSGSEKYQENEVQSVHSGAADNKGNALPSTCASEDVNENSDAQKCSGSEEYQENEVQSVHSGAADTKGNVNRDSQTGSESELFVVPPNECKLENNKESVIGVDWKNQGLPQESEENKDKEGKLIDSGAWSDTNPV